MANRAEVVDIQPIRSAPTYEQIAARAYAIFLARGAEHGRDVEDWIRAEQELIVTEASNARRSRGAKSKTPA